MLIIAFNFLINYNLIVLIIAELNTLRYGSWEITLSLCKSI